MIRRRQRQWQCSISGTNRKKQCFGGYHLFAKARNDDGGGSVGGGGAGFHSPEWSKQWAELDEQARQRFDIAAASRKLELRLDAAMEAARRRDHDVNTPWKAGDSEYPIRLGLLQQFVDEHGRDDPPKRFQENYRACVGQADIDSQASVQASLTAARRKAFLRSLRCCPQDHVGLCSKDDKYEQAVLGNKAVSLALDAVAKRSKDQQQLGPDDDEGFLQGAVQKPRSSALLGMLLMFTLDRGADGVQVAYALLAWRCLNPVREVYVMQEVVGDLSFAEHGLSLCYLAPRGSNLSAVKLRLGVRSNTNSFALATGHAFMKTLAGFGPIAEWRLSRLKATCESLTVCVAGGILEDMGTLDAWLPERRPRAKRGKHGGLESYRLLISNCYKVFG